MKKVHRKKKRVKSITAEEFDRLADSGGDITPYLDMKNAVWVNAYRVNVDFPAWMVKALDQEAKKLNVSRQAVIKMWINDRLTHRSPAA